ncbi:MAG: response regulator transcription factor [Bacteroidales bacterium]|nr:response regulator transcription factor [Bacteroidales bacterium]
MQKDKITAIIIDDEELARKVILKYMEKHPEIRVVEECENGFAGLKSINELKPDLVFLDIQMPKINGFELLEVLDNPPVIIFSTAHDEFALKAFEHSAVDYMLKPYSQKRFDEAIARALQRLNAGKHDSGELDLLKNELDSGHEMLNRVVVKSGSKLDVIPVEEIILLEAADDYVEIHTARARYLKQKPLTYFENHLPDNHFIRVHRSFIVAIDQIASIEPYSKENYMLILKNNREINVSKSGLKKLKEKLGI